MRLRTLSIAQAVTLLTAVLVVSVGGIATLISRRLVHSAAELDQRSELVPALFAELTDMAQSLNRALVATSQPAPADPAGRILVARALRDRIRQAPNRATAGRFADIPDAMRVALARADERVASLQIALLDYTALLELGRMAAARARLEDAAQLNGQVQALLSVAERTEVRDLLARQEDLRASAWFAVRAFVGWIAFMVAMLGVALLFVVRRVRRPLARLENGLHRVAAGDLAARVAVERDDELGRLAEHFNNMTAVLDRRAQAQGRFAAAGELLSGVAHEVNNPLMAIAATAEVQLAEEPPGSARREHYETILRQAQRAGRLLSGMLRFVRPREDEPDVADANIVIQEAVGLIAHRFATQEIQVEYALAEGLPRVAIAASRLEQVIINLIANAVDALQGSPLPRRIALSTELAGGAVVARIEDNGPGVDPAIIGALFSPFTTSKGERGTGLGLFMSRNIMRMSAGDLELEPPTTRWATRFAVRMVALPGDVARAAPPAQAAPGATVGSLAGVDVLLVDDEQPIRSALARFLAKRGASVRQAGDGIEALAALDLAPPDVIIADMRMPRMDGLQLYAEIARRSPVLAARMLFLTGDIAQLGDLAGAPELQGRVVTKPVELADLEARAVAVLAAARRAAGPGA